MCSLFGLSRSGYYAWLRRQPVKPNSELLKPEIKELFDQSKGTYGSPRMTIALQERGYQVSRSTVGRIMRSLGIMARPRRRYVSATHSHHGYRVAPNLLNREFTATRVNEKWVSDITYIPLNRGFVYLTVIIDLADRMVVGWNLSADMTAKNTVIRSFKNACYLRKVKKPLIFHSDRGVQYCSADFATLLQQNKWIRQSMSAKGNCWDNAVAESFFKTLKIEWVNKRSFTNIQQARGSLFDYIERWYNTKRKHSANDYLSPLEKSNLLCNRTAA